METICDCGHTVSYKGGVGTGYGIDNEGKKICYACCGEMDRKQLRETGKLSGYFTDAYFTNWPNTFQLPAFRIKKSFHNFCGYNGRTDFWVRFEENVYHGVSIGRNNELATIKINKKCKSM